MKKKEIKAAIAEIDEEARPYLSEYLDTECQIAYAKYMEISDKRQPYYEMLENKKNKRKKNGTY